MNFKRAFAELRKPAVWLHYALGSVLILLIFTQLMNSGIVLAKSSFYTYLITFFIVYVLSDRVVHGLMELN